MSFPVDGIPATLTWDYQGQFPAIFDDYFDKLTNGKLRLDPASGILLPPGEVLDEAHPTAQTWQAELGGVQYRTDASLPAGYTYRYLSDWWVGLDHYASPLGAEILHKIWTAYAGSGQDLFPVVPGADPEWQLFLLYVTNRSPYAWDIGGRPNVPVRAVEVNAGTDGFFANVAVTPGGEFLGTNQQALAADVLLGPRHPHAPLRPVIHEFIHTLGIPDGPPNLYLVDNLYSEMKYFYGNLNMISQAFPHDNDGCVGIAPFKGFPPLADPHLARLPWHDGSDGGEVVRDFSDISLWNEKVYSVGSGGRFYKYIVGENVSGTFPIEESFIFAYHAGDGLDDQGYVPGEPVVPSRGLAIWHCMGDGSGPGDFLDLESAHGLFDYKDLGLRTFVPYWGDPAVAAAANPIDGFDNYDLWAYSPTDYRTDYCSDDGSEADFFQINPTVPHLDKRRFDWTTNPNTNGYAWPDGSGVLDRRRPQNVPTSLVVRIRGTGSDANGEYMIVDLLCGPAERVVSPTLDGLVFAPGSTYDLTLSTDYAEAISSYDVYLSTDGGANYWYTVAEGVPYGPTDNVFHFTPQAGQGTAGGKLKFVFHNTRDPSRTAASTTDGLFTIDATVVVRGDITLPDGGEELSTRTAGFIEWHDFFAGYPALSPQIVSAQIELLTDCQIDPIQLGTFFNPTLVHEPVPDEFFEFVSRDGSIYGRVAFTPDDTLVCDRARIRVTFESATGTTVDESAADFAILPLPVRFVAEAAAEHGVDYTGRAVGMSVLHLDADDLPDLFVAIGNRLADPDEHSHLYRNSSLQLGEIRFTDLTGFRFVGGDLPPAEADAVAIADADGDGRLEIAMAHLTTPAFYVEGPDGVFANVLGDTNYFDPDEVALLAESRSLAWFDHDHDGDLDLLVGKGLAAGPSPTSLPPVLFRTYSQADGATSTRLRIDDGCGLTASESFTTAIAVADYDGDGLWEIVTDNIANPLGRLRASEEEIPGHFEAATAFATEFVGHSGLGAAAWADYDRDNDLDLVCVDQWVLAIAAGAYFYVYENVGGTLAPTPTITQALPGRSRASHVADMDLDGYPDVIVVGDETTGGEFFLNRVSDGAVGNRFVARGTASGFVSAGSYGYAAAIADFNGDGFADIIAGRDDLAGRVLRTVDTGPGGASAPNWLKLKLIGDGEDNEVGIGATVRLSTPGGDPLGAQVVVAASRAGGQSDPVLTFGLGTYAGDVNVRIDWPLGLRQDFTVGSGSLNSLVTMGQPVGFTLDNGSVGVTKTFDAIYGSMEWTFEWLTDRLTSLEYDIIAITNTSGGDCIFSELQVAGPEWITPARYEIDAVTGQVRFRHEATLRFGDCHSPCVYSYTVQSQDARDLYPQVSSTKTLKVMACPVTGGE
ncbi:MAG: CRTAC1 family protein [Krumholzibacteria bacterium]|nr:CRTAC1 family protein [Candidatus Krumholzibacteria bacterium]